MSERIENLTTATFKHAVDHATSPVLVDFWAPWCGPCKAIAPVLEELAVELDGKLKIAKVDVDQSGELAAEFGVRAIPTLLVFKQGKVAEQIVGMVGKEELKRRLAAHV
jgi:thioredoxin 1